MSYILRSILVTIVMFSSCSISHKLVNPSGNKEYKLDFHDEFNSGKLDNARWNYRTDSKHWSTQVSNNVTLDNGTLRLNVRKESSEGKEYTGAGIISKKDFGFGYYEARFKIPKGAGWHNSFWLMKHDGTGGTGPSATTLELDICENDSRVAAGYNVNVHRWQGEHIQRGTKWIKTPKLSEEFHTWGCEYSAEDVKYYFDGHLVQTISIKDLPTGALNIWLTTIASFHGNTKKVDDSLLPGVFEIDYVRYYSPASKR